MCFRNPDEAIRLGFELLSELVSSYGGHLAQIDLNSVVLK